MTPTTAAGLCRRCLRKISGRNCFVCYPPKRKQRKKPGPKPIRHAVCGKSTPIVEKPPPVARLCNCGMVLGPSNQTGLCPACRQAAGEYQPTEEQIWHACRAIQKTWSPEEEERRRCFRNHEPELKIVHMPTLEDD